MRPYGEAIPRTRMKKRLWMTLLAAGSIVFFALVPVAGAPAAPSSFDLSPSNVKFGRQTANTLTLRDVTVTNNNGDFVLNPPVVTGDTNAFAIQSSDCPTSPSILAGGASCTVTIRFVPPERGRYTGRLEIRSGVGVLLASARISGSTPRN